MMPKKILLAVDDSRHSENAVRYAESQAHTGNAVAFVKALRQANPIAYNDVVSCGDLRQSNCYYSSSDATFKNRYEADERYEELKAGKKYLKILKTPRQCKNF